MARGLDLVGEIEARWKALSTDLPSKLRQVPLGPLSREGIGVAIDPSGSRHLLLPHPGGEDAKAIFRLASVRLDRVNLRGRGTARTWLDLHCIRPELEDVFSRLCVDVIQRLPEDPAKTESSCLSTLQEWKSLLGSGTTGDRPASLIGVLGELLILRRLAEMEPAAALESWDGPKGGRHDFRRATKALEVKATLIKHGRLVEIHGLKQLEEPVNGSLHLVFTRLEKVAGGTHSLKSLVESICALGVDRDSLKGRLDDLGFGDPGLPEYRAEYEQLESQMYRIAGGFPRLVAKSFQGSRPPKGVVSINYVVDLEHSDLPALDAEAEIKVLKAILRAGRDSKTR